MLCSLTKILKEILKKSDIKMIEASSFKYNIDK